MSDNYHWPIEPRYKVIEHDKYGLREKHQILMKPKFHSGFDITAKTCTPVKPSSEGFVVFAGIDEKIESGLCPWNHRYGNKVEILDIEGRRIIYAHLREILVNVGEYIKLQETIALSGCSGGSRIPHLHFEIRNGDIQHSGEQNTINPLCLLPCRDLNSLTEEFDEYPYSEVWKKMNENSWALSDDDIPSAYDKNLIR